MSFKSFLIESSKRPFVYHVTYLVNLDQIGQSSLRARGGRSPWQKPHLIQNSSQGVFYCNDAKCVEYWIDMIAGQAYSLSDNPIDDQLIPIIIRFNLNPTKGVEDTQGEFTKSKFTSKEIPSVGLEMWNGREWGRDISSDAIDPYLFGSVWDSEYGSEQEVFTIDAGYPMPPELR